MSEIGIMHKKYMSNKVATHTSYAGSFDRAILESIIADMKFSFILESIYQLYPARFLCYAKIICGRYINARGWKDEQGDRFWSKKRFYLDRYQKR